MKGPCVFLASDASDYLNGAVIPVGWRISREVETEHIEKVKTLNER